MQRCPVSHAKLMRLLQEAEAVHLLASHDLCCAGEWCDISKADEAGAAVYMLCQLNQTCVMQASGARQAKLMQLLQKAEALGKPVAHPYTAIKLEPDPHHPHMDFKSLPHKSWYTLRLYRYIHQNSDVPCLFSRSANIRLAHSDLLHMHLAPTGQHSENGYCYCLAGCNLWILSQMFLCFSLYAASFSRHDNVV